jgi:Short C-terminal domain/Protein of unknown function (DUF2510)
MTIPPNTPPAGFYDQDGRQRWWDGTQWTNRFSEEPASASASSRFVSGLKGRAKDAASQLKEIPATRIAETKQNLSYAKDTLLSVGGGADVTSVTASGDPLEPLFEIVSHIEGKNAKVRLWPDRLEWERGRGISVGKLLAAPAAILVTGTRGGKDAYEMLPLAAVTSVSNRKDGLLYHVVTVQTAGGGVDFRVSREDAARFRQAMLDQLQARAKGAAVVPASAKVAEPSAPDPSTQLKQLAELRDLGILTDDEFAAKKAEILARM